MDTEQVKREIDDLLKLYHTNIYIQSALVERIVPLFVLQWPIVLNEINTNPAVQIINSIKQNTAPTAAQLESVLTQLKAGNIDRAQTEVYGFTHTGADKVAKILLSGKYQLTDTLNNVLIAHRIALIRKLTVEAVDQLTRELQSEYIAFERGLNALTNNRDIADECIADSCKTIASVCQDMHSELKVALEMQADERSKIFEYIRVTNDERQASERKLCETIKQIEDAAKAKTSFQLDRLTNCDSELVECKTSHKMLLEKGCELVESLSYAQDDLAEAKDELQTIIDAQHANQAELERTNQAELERTNQLNAHLTLQIESILDELRNVQGLNTDIQLQYDVTKLELNHALEKIGALTSQIDGYNNIMAMQLSKCETELFECKTSYNQVYKLSLETVDSLSIELTAIEEELQQTKDAYSKCKTESDAKDYTLCELTDRITNLANSIGETTETTRQVSQVHSDFKDQTDKVQ